MIPVTGACARCCDPMARTWPVSGVIGDHQIPLDLRPDAPEGFNLEPPGFMLHRWTGEDFVTHQLPVGRFGGPFPF